MIRAEDINSIESESGVIASLIHNPEWTFYSEYLLPNHFTQKDNRCVYTAICELAKRGITTIDPYNILEVLQSSDATRRFAEELTIESLQELTEMSDVLARNSIEEYKLLVHNIMDAAYRRDMLQSLRECEALCIDRNVGDVEQKVYSKIDGVMTEYSTANEVPPYRDVVDDCWNEIQERQQNGYSGIAFKFPTLNEYATIERGELFVFAAEAKQGKSMILLNCAMDLLKQGYKVLYLDSELNTRLFTARVLSHLTGIEYKRLTAGGYVEEEKQKIDEQIAWLKTRDFTHIYMPMFDVQSIYTTIKKVYHTQGIDVVIVDYFKGKSDSADAWEAYADLGRCVDMIKNQCCGDMNICGIGAAQATVNGKIADSAKISRNASTIAIIQDKTPEEIEMDGEECGNKKLRVIFNRNGAQMASDEYIDLRFSGNKILYEEAKQHQPHTPF